MFGISAFAQSPYASLGTNAYALSITEAPVPYPQDGKQYTWDEDTQSWVEVPTT